MTVIAASFVFTDKEVTALDAYAKYMGHDCIKTMLIIKSHDLAQVAMTHVNAVKKVTGK